MSTSPLGHGWQEGGDEEGRLGLAQEDVGRGVHGLGRGGADRDVEEPACGDRG